MKVRLIDSIFLRHLLPPTDCPVLSLPLHSTTEYVEKKAREEDDDVMKQRWPIAEFVEMQKPLFPTAVPQENVDDSPRTMSSSHGQSLSPGPSLNDERDYEIDEERNRLRELMMSVKGWVNVITFLCII